MHTAMIQIKLLFGPKEMVAKVEPKRMHVKIPKLMKYELTANIFQGQDMQPADDNGLADPYVKVSWGGVERETAVIEKTLQPIWYQRLTIPLDLPRDLHYAPKIVLTVNDSDPILGVSVKIADPIIGFALCPPDGEPTAEDNKPRSLKEYFIRPGVGVPSPPEWIELFSTEGMEAMAMHRQDPKDNERPPNVGKILVSFELRPEQDRTSPDLARARPSSPELARARSSSPDLAPGRRRASWRSRTWRRPSSPRVRAAAAATARAMAAAAA